MNGGIVMNNQIEPNELRDSVRHVLEKNANRRAPYSGKPGDGTALWDIIAELGWMLLTTPVELDGLGQSFVTLIPIYEELGRVVSSLPFAGSMAGIDVLLMAGGLPNVDALIREIGSGDKVAAVAFADTHTLSLTVGGDKVRMTGGLANVLGAQAASLLLLMPSEPDFPVIAIDLEEKGITVSEVAMWDRTRSLADIRFKAAAGHPLIMGADALAASSVARAHLDLAIAYDSLGGAEQLLGETIAYMGLRQQYGRPIGSFQALKHRAADLKVGLVLARAMASKAAIAFAERSEGWSTSAAQAKLLATSSYRAVAEESVQLHGGIGFTWEHDCHLFLKRACLNEFLGGTPEQYKDRIAPDIFHTALAGRLRTGT